MKKPLLNAAGQAMALKPTTHTDANVEQSLIVLPSYDPRSNTVPPNTAAPNPGSPLANVPFFPPQPRFPEWEQDLACPENLYFITQQVGQADPYKDRVTPTLFFDHGVLQELQYIGKRMYNITGESGYYFLYKQLQKRYPHFLIYEYFLVDQVASAGEVEMDGEDSKRYWDHLLATYPEHYGTDIHPHLGHGHWHPDGVSNFSSTDHKQQNTGDGLGFMCDFRPYIMMRRNGVIKAAMVQYYPVFRRIEDCHVGIHFPMGRVLEPLNKERKKELDLKMDALIKKRAPAAIGFNGAFGRVHTNPLHTTHNINKPGAPSTQTKPRVEQDYDHRFFDELELINNDYSTLTANAIVEARNADRVTSSKPDTQLEFADVLAIDRAMAQALHDSVWKKCLDKMGHDKREFFYVNLRDVFRFFGYYFGDHRVISKGPKSSVPEEPSMLAAARTAIAEGVPYNRAMDTFVSLEDNLYDYVSTLGIPMDYETPGGVGALILTTLLEVALVSQTMEDLLNNFLLDRAPEAKKISPEEVPAAWKYLEDNFEDEFRSTPLFLDVAAGKIEDASLFLARFVALADVLGDDVVEDAMGLDSGEILEALAFGVTTQFVDLTESEQE